ncbi:type II toxin-antitoxin system VapC family toxin [Natronorubrum daqingense]|uniref:PIN domain-containing protein n=1 Tax=Natronorubrum daqingense TaxID=588898 RepID=A0A1N7EPF2_9EURY|nr:PIN domain-containing protein [Natronorubrum daqingense]APX98282.1 PIN domain-containing protein [Natronorubrum daqingense]SIR89977.1 Predicted nucleic acid-binding protein, contains PIN domain [Natronorubrum daqingense]
MNESLPTEVTVLTDVNVLAIGLTDDHPAHDDVYPWIQNALDGPNVLLVFDYYPLRAQYLMTSNFGVDAVAARNAVQSLVSSPARIVSATETTLLEAYDISAEKNHDVYDAFILALARSYDADYLLTTDGDFDDLCAGEDVTYVNPIPTEKHEKLTLIDG